MKNSQNSVLLTPNPQEFNKHTRPDLTNRENITSANRTTRKMSYNGGDIVWVKLSNSWWPSEVCLDENIPDGVLTSLKKRPIAVVKFFDEETL